MGAPAAFVFGGYDAEVARWSVAAVEAPAGFLGGGVVGGWAETVAALVVYVAFFD